MLPSNACLSISLSHRHLILGYVNYIVLGEILCKRDMEAA